MKSVRVWGAGMGEWGFWLVADTTMQTWTSWAWNRTLEAGVICWRGVTNASMWGEVGNRRRRTVWSRSVQVEKRDRWRTCKPHHGTSWSSLPVHVGPSLPAPTASGSDFGLPQILADSQVESQESHTYSGHGFFVNLVSVFSLRGILQFLWGTVQLRLSPRGCVCPCYTCTENTHVCRRKTCEDACGYYSVISGIWWKTGRVWGVSSSHLETGRPLVKAFSVMLWSRQKQNGVGVGEPG